MTVNLKAKDITVLSETETFLLGLLKIRAERSRCEICDYCANEFKKIPGLYLTKKVPGVKYDEYSMEFTWPGMGKNKPVCLHSWIDDIPMPKARMLSPTDEGTKAEDEEFIPRVISQDIYGTGAAAGKGGAAVIYGVMSYLSRHGIHYPYDIKVHLTIGHREDASGCATLASNSDARGVILIEPTAGNIVTHSAGSLWLKLKFSGISCHMSVLGKGVGKDGKTGMYDLLGELRTLYDDYAEKTKNERNLPPCFNVGSFGSGRWPSAAISAEAKIATVLEPIDAADKFVENCKKVLKDSGAEFEILQQRKGVAKKKLDPFFKNFPDIAQANGMPAKITGTISPLELEFYVDKGIPAIAFGPADPNIVATTEERVSEKSLKNAIETISHWLERV